MRNLALWIAIVALSWSAGNAFALESDRALTQYETRRWDATQGLPVSQIETVSQTQDGYLWIGTCQGLVRFDGVRFTTLRQRTHPRLASDWIWDIFRDRGGNLWIATGLGLSYVPRGMDVEGGLRQFPLPQELSRVMTAAAAEDGSVWIGTAGGAAQIRNGTIVRVYRDELPGRLVRAILADRDGVVWIGTTGGLARWQNGTITRIGEAEGLGAAEITKLAQSRDGMLHVGTSGGLYESSGGRYRRVAALSGRHISAILEDRSGTMWYGTMGAGLYREIRRAGKRAFENGFRGDSVRTLFEDREGALWIGSLNGLTQLRDTPFIPFGKPEGLHHDSVLTLLQDRSGAIRVGTEQGEGIIRADGSVEWGTAHVPNEFVTGLAEAPDGSIWFATWQGACHRANGTTRCYGRAEGLSHESVMAVLPERDGGGVWIATLGGGLNYWRDGRIRAVFTEQNSELPANRVSTLRPARDGGVWVGSLGGVAHAKRGRVQRIGTNLPRFSVRSIIEDPDGTLWLTSSGEGIMHWDGRRATVMTLEHLTGSDYAYDIVDDRLGFLWVATTMGIVRISRADLAKKIALGPKFILPGEVFGRGSGMRTQEANDGEPAAIRTTDGKLVFATVNGLAIVDPRHRHRKSPAPNVVIEKIIVDGKEQMGTSAAIRGKRQRVTFRFTATALQNAEKTHFRYKLEGHDPEWIDAGNTRSATYTNLPPGEFVFRVTAANADGVWNEHGAGCRVVRPPTFVETPWFPLLLLAGFLLLAWIAVSTRVRHLRRNETRLIALVKDRTEELEAAYNVLKQVSLTDALTSLANRRHFEEHIEGEWRRAYRSQHYLAVLLLDVDWFKRYNDRYNHQKGDDCLRRVGAAIQRCVYRQGDLASRYGGEEFVVVLPACDTAAAMQVGENIRRSVAAEAIPHEASTVAPHVTVSIGVAAVIPEHSMHWTALVAAADAALYQAKHLGRNRVAAAHDVEHAFRDTGNAA